MKKATRLWSALLALAMLLTMLPAFGSVALADDAISYLDQSGSEESCTSYTVIDGSESDFSDTSLGWYVIKGNVSIADTLFFGDTANLILCDDATLTVDSISTGSLNVFVQSNDSHTGKLIVYDGIYCSNLNMYGGKVTVTSGNIGVQGNVYVYGGTLDVTGGIEGNFEIDDGTARVVANNKYAILGETIAVRGGDLTAWNVNDDWNNAISGNITTGENVRAVSCENEDAFPIDAYPIEENNYSMSPYLRFFAPIKNAAPVSYLDANGESNICSVYNDANTNFWLDGWYVAQGTVNFDGVLAMGDVHLILCDGAKVETGKLTAFDNLTIYAQSTGKDMGALHSAVYVSDNAQDVSGAYTINGGNISCEADQNGIVAMGGLTLNGGIVTLQSEGGTQGKPIEQGNDVTFGQGCKLMAGKTEASAVIVDISDFETVVHNSSDYLWARFWFVNAASEPAGYLQTTNADIAESLLWNVYFHIDGFDTLVNPKITVGCAADSKIDGQSYTLTYDATRDAYVITVPIRHRLIGQNVSFTLSDDNGSYKLGLGADGEQNDAVAYSFDLYLNEVEKIDGFANIVNALRAYSEKLLAKWPVEG